MPPRYALAGWALLALTAPAAAQSDSMGAAGPRTVSAGRAEGIRLDGTLDEAAWTTAEPVGDFVQFEPTEGAPASQRTEVRVLRGASDLYVGAVLYDAEPEGIRRILSRRDDLGGADHFIVALDAFDDRRTAYLFGVTAAGVQFDAVMAGGGDDDESWDAVWASAVRLGPEGWAVEMRIPYSQLRLVEGTPSWGVNFVRKIPRSAEQAFWAPFTREQANAGIVQYFGRLDGVTGVRPRRVMQVAPYSLARARRYEHEAAAGTATADYGYDVGADFKLGLSPNVILDATLNPDFGQVEADPAQLNLSTFETFFEERRPFFLEGTQTFDFVLGGFGNEGLLLYTRRVGAASPIIGAAKVSGRLAGGLSFGALGATTGEDFNPDRLYGAARLKQELGEQSYVGGALTAFGFDPNAGAEEQGRRSLAAGADWDLRLGGDDEWKLGGNLTGALRTSDDPEVDDPRGYALYVGFDRVKGFFTPGSGFRVYSAGFVVDDVGRFRQNDLVLARLGGGYLWNRGEPVGPFRRLESGARLDHTWRYADGTSRGLSFGQFTGGQLKNFWFLGLDGGVDGIGGYDVRETRGLGPVRNVRQGGAFFFVETDERRRLVFEPSVNVWLGADGGRSLGTGLSADWTASDRVTLSAFGNLRWSDGWRAWAANEGFARTADSLFVGREAAAPESLTRSDGLFGLTLDADGADALLDGVAPYDGSVGVDGATPFYLPVFGTRDTREANLSLRANVIFRPALSLQLYGQLFAARGQFRDFQLLTSPDEFRPFPEYPRRRDFAFVQLQANAVLRWEYRPGSTLFAVWTQARADDDGDPLLLDGGPLPPSRFDTATSTQLRDTFRLFPDNVFLVKLNYLLMR